MMLDRYRIVETGDITTGELVQSTVRLSLSLSLVSQLRIIADC